MNQGSTVLHNGKLWKLRLHTSTYTKENKYVTGSEFPSNTVSVTLEEEAYHITFLYHITIFHYQTFLSLPNLSQYDNENT